ncbi:MAG: SufD family Fe-S cluster assembly protein [Pyrobaculum sp.]
MDLSTARRLGLELASKLPWQEVADSPTVRYYTDWSKFEGFSPLARLGVGGVEAGPCEVVVVNGVLAGFGGCGGVEVGVGGEVFRLLSIDSRVLALHASVLQSVVSISIRRPLGRPLVIKLAASGPEGGHVASHVLLEAEAPGSVAVLVSNAAGVMHTAVIEAEFRGSTDFLLASRGAGPQYVHSRARVYSSARARPLVWGGVMNAVREEYHLAERAHADVVGLEFGQGDSRIDHVVSVVNEGRESRGYARLYAVAKDKSFVTQRAIGRITKTGLWSDNAVEGVVYIAGEGAVANTQPIILVETGEVAGARHSAADAALDEEREYYLRARGIDRRDIPALLVASLIDRYLAEVPEGLREVAGTLFSELS